MKRTYRSLILVFSTLVCVLSFPGAASGQSRTIDLDEEFESKELILPYAFYNDNFDFAAGFAAAVTGYPQEQMATVATAILSTNGSRAVYLLARDIQLPFLERLFLDPDFSTGRFGELDRYSDGDSKFPNERAGSNDSDVDNYITGTGDDHYLRLKFKYLLPLGNGRDRVINTYVLEDGLLKEGATGGDVWNPFESGRTFIELKPFYREQEIRGDDLVDESKTSGLELALFHDNRDFHSNPSRGSTQRIVYKEDYERLDSSAPWKVVEFEYSKYFSLGATGDFRQRVLALGFWTANTLTWDDSSVEKGNEVFHRPPAFQGATLGGIDRLRAYPTSRFNDQAAIYYTAELRLVPEWHPLGDVSWLEFLEIEWWQFVPFVEVGRVAEKWTLGELHSDLKWDAGVGVRAMAKRLIVRIDLAVGEEGGGVQMMVGQSF